MYIAIAEHQKTNIDIIRKWLIAYTIEKNIELEVLWFDDSPSEKVQKYAPCFSLAFISLNSERAFETGEKIYKANPDCYICYYNESDKNISNRLHSRPYEFFVLDNKTSFISALENAISEHILSKTSFHYETKRGLWCYPVGNIIYMQSNLKYVSIVTSEGDDGQIYAKLSDLENEIVRQDIKSQFLKIHKSYIVNISYIKSIDKKNHTVFLKDGTDLPISDAYYKSVIETMKNII